MHWKWNKMKQNSNWMEKEQCKNVVSQWTIKSSNNCSTKIEHKLFIDAYCMCLSEGERETDSHIQVLSYINDSYSSNC